MLKIRIRVIQNPWSHRVSDGDLVQIMSKVADERQDHIYRDFMNDNLAQIESGREKNLPSFAFVILDPTAPITRPSEETLLAIVEIGPDAGALVVNAVAKAVWHRDHGQLSGYGAYVDSLTSADGDFAWGYSSKVDNSIGGGSGLTEEQDAYEVGHALVSFNYLVRLAHKQWFEDQEERPSWFCNSNQPGKRYAEAVKAALTGPLHDSNTPWDFKMPLAYGVARY